MGVFLPETLLPLGGSRQGNYAIPSRARKNIKMGVSGRDRVMFLNKKTNRNNIPHKKGQFPSTSKNWVLSMERVDNMFSTRIISEGMEILRLGKSIQNPNHTKQGIGCQMY